MFTTIINTTENTYGHINRGGLYMKDENKLKKHIAFDLLDAEILESYLKEMASKGWIIDEIGTLYLYFKKSEPKDLEFFVDLTTKDMLNTYEMPKEEYLSSHKENNLEHICNNKKFQVFINHGNKYPLERKKSNFLKAFEMPIILLFVVIFYMYIFYTAYINEGAFVYFISNNLLILSSLLLVIILAIVISINVFNINKYIRKKQTNNNNFNSIKNFKIKNRLIKYNYYCITFLIVISVINSIISSGVATKLPNKSDLPVKLEDFDVKISPMREISKENYSSVFATYSRYMDSTYEEVYKTEYNKETKEEEEVFIMKDSYDLDYTIFETKYKNIMDSVIDDGLNISGTYKKTADKELLKNWGAKTIYCDEESSAKIIVYDNRMINIYTNIDLDKEKIDFIKSKILN